MQKAMCKIAFCSTGEISGQKREIADCVCFICGKPSGGSWIAKGKIATDIEILDKRETCLMS